MQAPKNYQFEVFKKFNNQDAYPLAERWLSIVCSLPQISRGEITGELRRGKPSISKIEILVASPQPAAARNSICDMLSSRRYGFESQSDFVLLNLENGMQISIWLTTDERFGSILHATTGSQAHLNWFALRAAQAGFKYENGGLFYNERFLSFAQEKLLFQKIDLPFIPPELREGALESLTIASDRQFNLVDRKDLCADLHVHSTWSDGIDSMENMVKAAINNNLELIAFTDHSPHIMKKRYTDHTYLFKQQNEIDALKREYGSRLQILKGVEVDILDDGSLDLTDDILSKMEIVIASMHTHFDQPIEIITNRYLKAIQNPYVNIIGHPGGRLFPMSDFTYVDWDIIFRAAAMNNVALEINSHKSHPLFDGERVYQAALQGVPIVINSDAHHTGMFENSLYGTFIARRAGLQKSQVINTWRSEDIKFWLNTKGKSTHRCNI